MECFLNHPPRPQPNRAISPALLRWFHRTERVMGLYGRLSQTPTIRKDLQFFGPIRPRMFQTYYTVPISRVDATRWDPRSNSSCRWSPTARFMWGLKTKLTYLVLPQDGLKLQRLLLPQQPALITAIFR